jgi:dihydrofolate reductase
MTQFILQVATSLDGYIARLDGSIDWLPSPQEGESDYGYQSFYDSIDVLVMGSTTYEQVLGFGDWPYPGKQTYVLTTRNLSTARADVSFIKGGIPEVVKHVHNLGCQRVWLVGGGKVISSFMNQGLVDEYIIAIIPIILGEGISLYQSVKELKLDLVEVKSYAGGVVALRYLKK